MLRVITKSKEPSVELHEIAPDPQRIARTKRIVAHVWRAIAAGHVFPAPSAMTCSICPFREPFREWMG